MSDATPPVPEPAEPVRHPWAELAPERFHLLRLAPLPTDRSSGPRPLRFVEMTELERHSAQASLLRLAIRLPGQRVHSDYNLLEVWADHRAKEVRFGPEGGLRLEPVNRGLGRFLLAQGAAWAKKRWSHYALEGAVLRDTISEDERQRRDQALRAQGLEVVYPQPQQLKALYQAANVGLLSSEWNHDKVRRIELPEAAAMLEQADRSLQEQASALHQLKERLDRLRREDGTLRFTIACLVAFALFQGGLLIWIATR